MSESRDICPNCMEPIEPGQGACPHCEAPLTGDQPTENLASEANLSQGSTKTSENQAPAPQKPKKRNFTYLMRGFGIYIIFVAVTDLPRSFKLEEPKDMWLAIAGNVIYLAAGILMALPLFKEFIEGQKKKRALSKRIDEEIASEQSSASIEIIEGEAYTTPDSTQTDAVQPKE